ncbi:hypothetical protein ATANTOWER_011524, partial [Ataeniobius toweri]|nr:hypothetical protein [Ataeniobius toweri]
PTPSRNWCNSKNIGCSDWLALGKADIMFSPEPTCIPPSTIHGRHDCELVCEEEKKA